MKLSRFRKRGQLARVAALNPFNNARSNEARERVRKRLQERYTFFLQTSPHADDESP